MAARDEVDSVDAVLLPESAVDESDINDLEALLDRHGVIGLMTGVRQRSANGRGPPMVKFDTNPHKKFIKLLEESSHLGCGTIRRDLSVGPGSRDVAVGQFRLRFRQQNKLAVNRDWLLQSLL